MIEASVLPEMDGATPNACGYIRLFLPLTCKRLRDEARVTFTRLENIKHGDVIIAQRLSVRSIEGLNQIRRVQRASQARFIYDIDDDLLALADDHPEYELYHKYKPIILAALRMADQVWVSTQVLNDRYQSLSADVRVIPNRLDARVWPMAPRTTYPDGSVRFLCMGTASHRGDFLNLVLPAFVELQKEFGSVVQLDVVGILSDEQQKLPFRIINPPTRIAASYPCFAGWLHSLPSYDIGLAPLLDTEFNRAKSSIKILEYSALGMGSICSSLPPYQGDAAAAGQRSTAPTLDGFYSSMRDLVIDADQRNQLRSKATNFAAFQLTQEDLARPTAIRELVFACSASGDR